MPLTEHMEVAAQQYCLRWKYHHSNLQVMFAQLLERESFCDVTLACEGRTLRAHKMMLSACSTYFDAIFSKHEEKDPIVILKDVKFDDIKALVEFMYKGEINVENSQLNTLLQTAEELRIKGLAAVSWRSEGEGAWRTVQPTSGAVGTTGGATTTTTTTTTSSSHVSNNSHHQNQRASHKYPQQSSRKRKMKNDYSYVYSSNKKSSAYVESQQSADDYAGSLQSESGGEEDSQEGMWDTRSHEEVYSESEDIKPRVSNSNPNSLSVPATEGDSSAQAENDEDETESRESPALSTNSQGNGNGSTNNGTSNNSVSNNINNGSGGGGNTPNSFQSTPQSTTLQSSTPVKQELMDVIKMTAYIQQGGRRPHFWETSSTKRVMEAIKNKEIEMKVAAELLGVSYGTLYGRYRDAYGCLKHPYRVREFWHEAPSVEVITKLQRKELSLFKAAEMLNVTVTTLANYLAALNREEIEEGDEDADNVSCAQQALSINPDITIVKKEKQDDPSTSVNGNK